MRKNTIFALLLLLPANYMVADEVPRDTIKVVDIEEITVVATPKENKRLRELPAAVTLLSQQDMQAQQVSTIKNLTGIVPNMFIPDYGSKLTSAIYIRGIGSRINTPSVGLYVDNMPYIDKSAFDFNYSDVERIDVLRGPQGTLYGRNTMGGLIRVFTKSPFNYQGTDVKLGAGTYGNFNASLTHYHRISEQFAFSAGGFYEHSDGFFKNYQDKKVDKMNDVGGRIRAIYLPSENLKLDFNVSYEYSDQGGYPYFFTGIVDAAKESEEDIKEGAPYVGKISSNEDTYYRRNLLNAGINIEYQARHFIFSAVTGYQHLKDQMHIDQDFTFKDYFNLTQKQRYNTISEELVFKSKPGRNWQWTTGAFGFYQWLKTEGPVTFKEEGIEDIIEKAANDAFANLPPNAPKMSMDIKNNNLLIGGNFDTPMLNGAIYHQSTFNNIIVDGLSFTAGLRLDYEKMSMKYNSVSDVVDFDFNLSMMGISDNMKAPAELKGKLKNDYLQLLPKFAVQYEWNKSNNVYATVSRGYRSGGYNVQMFSNLIQSQLKNSMKAALLDSEKIGKHPTMGTMISTMINSNMKDEVINVEGETTYKPEYSWNYEIGSHLTLWDGKLWADIAAFYMDTRDQQVSQFAKGDGLGRITTNAGKSRSIGAEAAIRTSITESLSFNASYGYTHSTFRDYQTIEDKEEVNYKGNYVPFVPKHTFNLGGQYIFFLNSSSWLKQIQLNLNYNGAGRIYWTENNTASQPFYGTLNGSLTLSAQKIDVSLWTRNILNEKYNTFYFESRNRGFEQHGRPFQLGVEARFRF